MSKLSLNVLKVGQLDKISSCSAVNGPRLWLIARLHWYVPKTRRLLHSVNKLIRMAMVLVPAMTVPTPNETPMELTNRRHSSARVATSTSSMSGAITTNPPPLTILRNRSKYSSQWHKAGSSGTSRQNPVLNGTYFASSTLEFSHPYPDLTIFAMKSFTLSRIWEF